MCLGDSYVTPATTSEPVAKKASPVVKKTTKPKKGTKALQGVVKRAVKRARTRKTVTA
jgi:hypothetical protein